MPAGARGWGGWKNSLWTASTPSPRKSFAAPKPLCARKSPNCRAASGPTKPGATALQSPSWCAARSKWRGGEYSLALPAPPPPAPAPQSTRGINVVLNYTHAYASFAIKAAICPDVPHNEGSFRPVHVTAPPGSILNALDPAPVASRQVIGHFIPSAIFAALSVAMPGRLMAPGADPIWLG